jgi:hypothetical protein
MRKISIIALLSISVSLTTSLCFAGINNTCPFVFTFNPPSTPEYWAWIPIASMTPIPFDQQKKYRFYAEFYSNDKTSSFFQRAICLYVSAEPNCTPQNCPSFVLISTVTYTKPLNAAPWNTILANQPPNSFACQAGDWQTNQQSPLACILTR